MTTLPALYLSLPLPLTNKTIATLADNSTANTHTVIDVLEEGKEVQNDMGPRVPKPKLLYGHTSRGSFKPLVKRVQVSVSPIRSCFLVCCNCFV